MDEQLRKYLFSLRNTLETITVSGKDNLLRMSGCMELLDQMLATPEPTKAEDK